MLNMFWCNIIKTSMISAFRCQSLSKQPFYVVACYDACFKNVTSGPPLVQMHNLKTFNLKFKVINPYLLPFNQANCFISIIIYHPGVFSPLLVTTTWHFCDPNCLTFDINALSQLVKPQTFGLLASFFSYYLHANRIAAPLKTYYGDTEMTQKRNYTGYGKPLNIQSI